MKTLIAVHGKKGVGKDTFVRVFLEEIAQNKSYVVLAFADKLKDMCSVTFDVPRSVFDDQELKEKVIDRHGMSPRDMMKTLSDVVKAQYGEDFFLKPVAAKYSDSTADVVVVSDLRFYRERKWVDEDNAIVVHILRETGNVDTHMSELGLLPTQKDVLIQNDGTVDELREKVREFIRNHVPDFVRT